MTDKLKPACIIGLGNDFRSDDQLGFALIRELKVPLMTRFPDVSMECFHTSFDHLLWKWEKRSLCVLLDAVFDPLQKDGNVQLYSKEDILKLRGTAFSQQSTHSLGLKEAVQLGDSIGMMPSQLYVVGVASQHFTQGQGRSDKIKKEWNKILQNVQQELERLLSSLFFRDLATHDFHKGI